MNEAMEPIHPAHAAMLMGRTPEPCEPFVEISSKVLSRLLDVVEFGDQLERVEKDNLLSSLKELLALEQPELWVIHSVGPGELHPMISKEAADLHAAELADMFKEHIGRLGLRFDVIRSPFTPLEHFETLAEEADEHRNNLLEHVKSLEMKAGEPAAPAVVNQQLTTAEFTSVRCQCCQTEHAAGSYDAGFIAGSGMCQACDAAIPAKDIHTPAARDVLAERQRQVTAEGWTPEHDDEHSDGGLAAAAACYAMAGVNAAAGYEQKRPPLACWPWARSFWKPGTARRMLVKAAALILAEIERLDRAEVLKGEQDAERGQ